MATYKIDSSLLTAQANEIRTLNGTTATMNPSQMTTALQSANAEVAEQEQKIIEITEMLQGKAMGGNGEDVTAEVTAQTELLADLESAVNALPEAGGSVETCTVTLSMPIAAPDAGEGNVYFVKPDGSWSEISVDLASGDTIIDVLQNSIMVTDITSDGDAVTTNCERIYGLYTCDVVYIGAVDSATVKIY